MPAIAEVEQLLVRELAWKNATNVAKIGEGAWSTAFGFSESGRELVIRLGEHESDFRRDQTMSRLATSGLPIPDVLDVGKTPEVGAADGLHYCVSTRACSRPERGADSQRQLEVDTTRAGDAPEHAGTTKWGIAPMCRSAALRQTAPKPRP